jgi:Na+/melibiose symporter-like transporter
MSQFMSLKQTISNPKIYLPILFIFAWQATPSADSALFFFQINELGFKPEFLGSVRLAASIASLVGVVIFRSFLKDLKTKDVIFWTTLISVPLAMTQLLLTTHANRAIGIPDQLFALTDTVVLTVLGQIAFMPTLVLAASLCPPGVEGTVSLS